MNSLGDPDVNQAREQAEGQLTKTLVRVFRRMKDEASEQDEHDFVFHLAECADDLERFCRLRDNPAAYSFEESRAIVASLLYHASGHLAQAARLYDHFVDPFNPSR
ncbi:MAG: hypothetical protein U0271_21475 [Polyangiaceae bacterium]